MICEKCNAAIPPASRFCLSCGTPVPENISKPVFKPKLFPLFLYVGVVILAWIFKDFFNKGIFTWGLMALIAFVIFVLRHQLVTILLAIDNLSILKPFWKVQEKIPQGLRKTMGFIAPFILAFLLTAPLSSIFDGCGHMIFLVSLPISILVAHLFMAPIPAKFLSK
ncbi:MAG: zinc ribbon domain-containing protein [Desulfocapsa sp.]|nr:zinc ribbon domain-containing protein [Desulfocapsa sp.]